MVQHHYCQSTLGLRAKSFTYFKECRSLSRHKQKFCILSCALIEHFLEGRTQLRLLVIKVIHFLTDQFLQGIVPIWQLY